MNLTIASSAAPKLWVACLVSLAAGQVMGQQPPSVNQPSGLNLGVTSFYDGLSGGPGWAYQATYRQSNATKIADADGNDSTVFKNPSIKSDVMINQLSYAFAETYDGWRPGVMVILPAVSLNTSFGSGPSLKGGGTALGDMALEATLQSAPVTNSGGKPVFVQRLAAAVILPTGEYKKNLDINQGSGYASFNPSWSATLFPAQNWEVSLRANYLYNFKNNSPASSGNPQINGQAVTDTQAGDAAWVNFAASYAITPELSVGLNGYYFEQLSNHRANGIELANSRERVMGIGPGLMWRIDPKKAMWVNAYSESMARNRTASPLTLQVRTVFAF